MRRPVSIVLLLVFGMATAAGEYHLYLGGSVTPSVKQPAGTYNGDFDITVSCATQ